MPRAEAENENPVLHGVGNIHEIGLVCKRLDDGRLACNIPQIYKHHSPTGYECGYGGSGPADLALNVMAIFCPLGRTHNTYEEAQEGEVKLWDGTLVSQRAWDLHQNFKWQHIANMDRKGGTISAETIRKFIAENYVEQAA